MQNKSWRAKFCLGLTSFFLSGDVPIMDLFLDLRETLACLIAVVVAPLDNKMCALNGKNSGLGLLSF